MSTHCWLAVWLLCCVAPMLEAAPDAPLPDSKKLKEQLIKNLRRSEDALENYSCTVREENDELNSDGSVKKHESAVKERFYLNGIEISHTFQRNGKPLNRSDARKEQARVDEKVKRFSDLKEARKVETHGEKQADMFLRALQITNGRREVRNGRNTLVYDLSGDPAFKPRKLEERFAEAVTGGIAIDEESDTPVVLSFRTIRDVRIGGGLLANLHRGFWLHVTQQREPDGVWITKNVQGSGDARAALFLHASFRFKEQLENCHLYSVSTQQNVGKPASSPPLGQARP